jgi:hypothetical protein
MLVETPTYIGYKKHGELWAFSPTPMLGCDIVYNISNWAWEDVMSFMNDIPTAEKLQWLQHNAILYDYTDLDI